MGVPYGFNDGGNQHLDANRAGVFGLVDPTLDAVIYVTSTEGSMYAAFQKYTGDLAKQVGSVGLYKYLHDLRFKQGVSVSLKCLEECASKEEIKHAKTKWVKELQAKGEAFLNP